MAALLFIILTALKLIFPEQTGPAREALRQVLSHDTDYMAVFQQLGREFAADSEVVDVLMQMTGHRTEAAEYYTAGTINDLLKEQQLPLPEAAAPIASPEPTASPSPEPAPTEEPVPDAVAAFLEQQAAFADYSVPANVSYGYPTLPFDYVSPVSGMTSSGFGYRMHPLRNEVLFHYGTDFAAWTGTEILAFAGGTVGMVGWDAGYGNYIIVQHTGGWRTLYAHCSAVYVTGGDAVSAGQCIGLVGATGNVTGPHLHLELTCDGVYYNPEFYLA